MVSLKIELGSKFLSLFFLSGMDVLQYNDVSFEMLASVFPECLSPYVEFSQRLKIEGKTDFGIFKQWESGTLPS